MNTKKPKEYSLDFKISSAKLAVDSEQSVNQTAKDLGLNVNTLHGWIKKYVKPQTMGAISSQLPEAKFHEELKRLQKENARLKQERDILKKATAYFAAETL